MNTTSYSTQWQVHHTDMKHLFSMVMLQVLVRSKTYSIEKKRQRHQIRSSRVRTPSLYSPKNFRTRVVNPIK